MAARLRIPAGAAVPRRALFGRGLFVPVIALLCTVAQAGGEPDVVLRGRITGADHQTYRLVPFDVPAGVERITVEFDYTGRDERTSIDLGLLGPGEFHGPDGLRGWSGGNKRTFTVSATDATPSYLPGSLAPGRWNLLLSIPSIRPDVQAEFTARVYFSRGEQSRLSPAAEETPLRAGAGWYRGDLHLHTGHSDGSCASRRAVRVPCPLFLTLSGAADRGLDFVAVTEHNTISHIGELRTLQPYFDDLLLIPGMEVTTFQGHANAFGLTAPIDFRVGSPSVPDWTTLLQRLAQRGLVVSINHPAMPSGEICMGCGWRPQPPADLRLVQAVEVVNGADADTPVSGIPFWHRLLDQGYRLTGIGGSDNHDARIGATEPGRNRIGSPTTVVYARNLSAGAIADGLRSGQVFIDVQGGTHRLLELSARTRSAVAHMGGELRLGEGEEAQIAVRVTDVPGGVIEIIRDGVKLEGVGSTRIGTADHEVVFTERGDGRRHWLRVDVRDAQGRLVLVGNPIYFNREADSGKAP